MINQLRQYQIHGLLSLSSLSNRALSAIFIAIEISLLPLISVLVVQIRPPHVMGEDFTYQPDIAISNIFADIGPGPFGSDQQMKKFSSYSELRTFLKDVQTYFAELNDVQRHNLREGGIYGGSTGTSLSAARSLSLAGGLAGLFAPLQQRNQASVETNEAPVETFVNNHFSGTNVQVAEVDEADFLKTDGKYVYIISGDRLRIIDAYPPNDAKVVSKTTLDIPEGRRCRTCT